MSTRKLVGYMLRHPGDFEKVPPLYVSHQDQLIRDVNSAAILSLRSARTLLKRVEGALVLGVQIVPVHMTIPDEGEELQLEEIECT